MKERNVKVDILMCIVAVLLCATLCSMHLAGGLYARYTTSTSGGDSARVAECKIKQDGTIFKTVAANVTPGTTQSADLIITNKSEVSVEYTVKVTNVTRNLPLEFTLTPKAEAAASEGQNTPSEDQAASPIMTPSHSDGISTNNARQIPGDHTDEYILNITWKPNEDNEEDLALIGMVDYVTVSVTAAQID